ncbi:MAG: MBL fold metallo-hydrolase [Endozoicomonadaceae bacterium]|nr:MBL fold metallo-hydrolase [Endozoicomonadaceae bacterium]
MFLKRTTLALLVASLSSLTSLAIAESCTQAALAVQILGSGGPELDDQRASSSYLVWQQGKAKVLIDMGGGSALRFEESGAKVEDLAAVAFTHLHVDHSADFPALIKSAFFSQRKKDLPVYGTEGNHLLPSITGFMDALIGKQGTWPYLADFLPKNKGGKFKFIPTIVKQDKTNIQRVHEADGIKLSAIATHHGPLPALAWRIDIAGKAISFSGDMNDDFHTFARLAKGSDVMIAHNAVPEAATGVARHLHMPPSVIGKLSKQAGVKHLVLSHRMKRTLGREAETARLIKQKYQGKMSFANDLDCFVIQ